MEGEGVEGRVWRGGCGGEGVDENDMGRYGGESVDGGSDGESVRRMWRGRVWRGGCGGEGVEGRVWMRKI